MKNDRWRSLLNLLLPIGGLLVLFVLRMLPIQLPSPEDYATPVPTTVAPPADVGHRGVITDLADCFDWSYHSLKTIHPGAEVTVLGRNQDALWYMVRLNEFGIACWVRAGQVSPSNFRPGDLELIPQLFPPPSPVPTTDRERPSLTPRPQTEPVAGSLTPSIPSPAPSPTKIATQASPTRISPSPTTVRAPTITAIPSNTSTPTITVSITPTFTATQTSISTSTPTHTQAITPTTPASEIICHKPAAPTLEAQRTSRDYELMWNTVLEAEHYSVYRSFDSINFVHLTDTPNTIISVSVPRGAQYHFYVKATNHCGESAESNTVGIPP